MADAVSNSARVIARRASFRALLNGSRVISRVPLAIQGKWKCNNCQYVGEGKPRKKCPECGKTDLQEFTDERPPFGTWWKNLDPERRQKLIRANGSHEANGGVKKKQQGGGAKGNQHSNGVSNAQQQIKSNYLLGQYD
jgi:hypothetical protein